MRRELLLLEEMIDAAEQAHLLAATRPPSPWPRIVSGARACPAGLGGGLRRRRRWRAARRGRRPGPRRCRTARPAARWRSPERVERRVLNSGDELGCLPRQPGRIGGAGPARRDVEEPSMQVAVLVAGEVDHAGDGPILRSDLRGPPDVLIDAQSRHASEPGPGLPGAASLRPRSRPSRSANPPRDGGPGRTGRPLAAGRRSRSFTGFHYATGRVDEDAREFCRDVLAVQA
jgi:hypothetical protein